MNGLTCSSRSREERLGWKSSSAAEQERDGNTEVIRRAGVDWIRAVRL